MRSSRAVAVFGVLAIAAMSGCTQAPPAKPAVDQAAIGTALDGMATAFNAAVAARDSNAILNNYADDAHLMPANGPRADGKEAIRKAWSGFLAIPGMGLTTKSNTRIVSESGDIVADIGSYVFKWNDAKGKPMSDTGKYLTLFKKTDAGWKIVADTWNSDSPPPGM